MCVDWVGVWGCGGGGVCWVGGEGLGVEVRQESARRCSEAAARWKDADGGERRDSTTVH